VKGKLNRIITLTSVVTAAVFIGVIGVALSTTSSTALATPGRTGDCTGCHDLRAGNLRITTDTTTKTVAPGETFVVVTSFTGGNNNRTEINWPNVASNTLFAPTPRVPFSIGASTGSASSTLTAPATPGTYTVRVFAAQGSPEVTDYKDMEITVSAATTTYTVAASAGANGSITPSGAVTVNSGASRTFAIAAATGYHVDNVLVDGTSVGTLTSYTFTNVTAGHTISATFTANAAPTAYTITTSAGANGSISPSGVVTVNSGSSQTFAIAAGTGYRVASVLVDGASAGPVTSYTFTNVTAGHTISATFIANTATTAYTITASAGANGSITPSGVVTVNSGARKTFTFSAKRGYHIARILVDGRSVSVRSSYTFWNVKANHTISVTFAPNRWWDNDHDDDERDDDEHDD
jgi:hypothetical protein